MISILLSVNNAMSEESACSWCEGGDATCDWTYSSFDFEGFNTSVSASVEGRAMPYVKPTSQVALGVRDDAVTTAIIVHHGAGRNAEDYLSYMVNAILNNQGSENAVQLKNTIVVAPQVYEAGDDGLDQDIHLWWDESSDDGFDADTGERDWKWGGNSTSELPASISTFQVLDEMLDTLADKSLYPNLQSIVMAGHSAGGQIMQRYALFSTRGKGGERDLGLDIEYYVANPSSTTYLGPERPVKVDEDDRDCAFCINSTIETQDWTFATPSADLECASTYNKYGYGLEGDLPDYPASTTVAKALAQYPLRRVTYMSGQSDVCDTVYMQANQCVDCTPDDGGLDPSCEGYSQGWCRMSRLHGFAKYVQVFYDQGEAAETHHLMSVPNVGHSGCGMFQSAEFAAQALTKPNSILPRPNQPTTSATATVPAKAPSRFRTASRDYTYSCTPAEASEACEEADPLDGRRQTSGGHVLMGGSTDVDAAFKWQISKAGGGDFLVLRESGTDAYDDWIMGLSDEEVKEHGGLGLRTAATLILNSRRAASDEFVLSKVRSAEAIFFAGGDQSNYVERIAGTPLEPLLRSKSGSVSVGGTSAGNAIQGWRVYTGAHGSSVSENALADPFERTINGSIVGSLITYHGHTGVGSPLDSARVLMDDHFKARDRMGRMITFVARTVADGLADLAGDGVAENAVANSVRAIGVDERTALLVQPDGTLTAVGNSTAYCCTVGADSFANMVCSPGKPLTLPKVSCVRIAGSSFTQYDDPAADAFDLGAWAPLGGTGVSYSFDVVEGRIVGDAYGPSA